MVDFEKVIKGLEQCKEGGSCDGCPYDINSSRCLFLLRADALALLKEQPQIVRCKDCKAWKQYDDMNLGECELYPEYNKLGNWFCNFGERKE